MNRKNSFVCIFIITTLLTTSSVSVLANASTGSIDVISDSFWVWGVGRYRVTIYYPTDSSEAPYPAVIFAHGFLSCMSWHTMIGDYLGSRGYVVLIFTVPDRYSSNVNQWVNGIEESINYLQFQNNRRHSELFNMIDLNRIGVIGHSMGGMASLIAASNNPDIDTAVVIAAPYLKNLPKTGNEIIDDLLENIDWDAALTAAGKIMKPMLFMYGTKDKFMEIDPTKYYDTCPSSNKELVTIEGGNHVGFLDNIAMQSTLIPLIDLLFDLPLKILFSLLLNLPSYFEQNNGEAGSLTIIDFAIKIGIDNPADITPEVQQEESLEEIVDWFYTFL